MKLEKYGKTSEIARLQLGMYSIWIKKWLQVYPRDQIMIIPLEDYSQNMNRILNDAFHFLNLGLIFSQYKNENNCNTYFRFSKISENDSCCQQKTYKRISQRFIFYVA